MAKLIPENLKNRAGVPHAIRRVASVLENLPGNAVVWFEPLFDPTGEKPDFVIWLPARGMVVLEVLDAQSDIIMGVKRGKIVLLRDGSEVKIENPFARADRFVEQLRIRVTAESRLAGLDLRVAAGACLPHLSVDDIANKNLGTVFDPSFTICRDDLSETNLHLPLAACDRLLGDTLNQGFPNDIDKIVRGIIQPDIVISTISQISGEAHIFQPSPADQDTIRVMDREQESLAKSLGDGHRVIKGVAGSGKTLILVFRAKLLARCNPNARYLVVCYARALAGHLKRLLADYPNVDIANIDKLARDLAKKNGSRSARRDAAYDPELIISDALKSAENGHGDRYDAVLVDEAQDLDSNALTLLTKLLKPGSEDLLIVADAAQNIFRRKFSWKSAGIKAQGRTRLLNINYRNTREILAFASSFLFGDQQTFDRESQLDDEYSYIPPESSKRTGLPPELKFVKDQHEEISATVTMAAEWASVSRPGQRLAVLYPGTDGINRGRRLNNQMRQLGLKFLSVQADESAKIRLSSATESVILSTVQSAKGLEFSHVIICGTWWDSRDLEVNRKLAYVGMTRATDHLVVVSRETNKLAEALRRAMEISSIAEKADLNPVATTNSTNQGEVIEPLQGLARDVFKEVVKSGYRGTTAKAIARDLELDLNAVKLVLHVDLAIKDLVWWDKKKSVWRTQKHAYAIYSTLCPE